MGWLEMGLHHAWGVLRLLTNDDVEVRKVSDWQGRRWHQVGGCVSAPEVMASKLIVVELKLVG
eukprot:3158568-Amphidinium_carterae.4